MNKATIIPAFCVVVDMAAFGLPGNHEVIEDIARVSRKFCKGVVPGVAFDLDTNLLYICCLNEKDATDLALSWESTLQTVEDLRDGRD